MLSVGVNLKKIDFNRKEVIVHHITDDVTGKALPICGAKIDKLLQAYDVEYILKNLGSEGFDYFSRDDSILCERCRKSYLSPNDNEKQSMMRLRRHEAKEAKKRLVKEFERQLTRFLKACPKCDGIVRYDEPLELDSKTACDVCGLTWTFYGWAKDDGRFTILVNDEERTHDGKLRGHIADTSPHWIWREINSVQYK